MILLLDLDDTLTDADRGFSAWAQKWVARFTAEHRAEMVDFLTGDEVRPMYPQDRLAAFRQRFGVRASAGDLHADYIAQAAAHTHLVDGALAALARARRSGFRLGVVTNGPADLQRAKLEHLRLTEHVDRVVISGEAGVAKPDPAIFALAIERLGGPGGARWMIGDNPVADIGGARAAGIRSVWLRHGRAWDDADGPVDRQADTITDAVDRVSREAGEGVARCADE
ncbi:HAD family hydrolase [Segeticoccus rhizosphaerae]|uniref:HAD family hydrolase n=1 Tax=Segeticoccus rhizosphaerae TaxID=1104777 RepID=UPI0012645AEA|nr:HAD-IA family hydrolase [Segeticoccus rhizosphaerae]